MQLFGETSYHLGDSDPLQPRFGTLRLLTFPKTKITFERDEIQENRMEQLMAIKNKILQSVLNNGRDGGRTVWGPKVPTWKRTEVPLSYIQCLLYLVSSSINISIFCITWLDIFWTGLIYIKSKGMSRYTMVTLIRKGHMTILISDVAIFMARNVILDNERNT